MRALIVVALALGALALAAVAFVALSPRYGVVDHHRQAAEQKQIRRLQREVRELQRPDNAGITTGL